MTRGKVEETDPVVIRYDGRLFVVIGTFLIGMLLFSIWITGSITDFSTDTEGDGVIMLIMMPIYAILFIIGFVMLHAATGKHVIEEGMLKIRFGIVLRGSVPLGQIMNIETVDRSELPWYVSYGIKTSLARREIYAITSFKGLIRITFKQPHKLRMLGIGKRSTYIYMSVLDDMAFITAVKNRM